MFGKTLSLYSEEDTDSELYVDADDGETADAEIRSQNGELDAFHSTMNIPDNTTFQIGVYSQIIETRIVITNGNCKVPERKARKLEETILTCQMMARKTNQKPICAICGNPTIKCTCNIMKTLLQSPAGCSKSRKEKMCSACKQPISRCICKRMCKGRSNNTDVISLLRGIQQISLPQRNNPCIMPSTRPKSRVCSIPVKIEHVHHDRECRSLPAYQVQKPSFSNCAKIHLLNNLRAYKLPDTFFQHKCLACKRSVTKCVCGTLRTCPEVCRECEESIPQCKCHKWKGLKEINRRNQCCCGPAKPPDKNTTAELEKSKKQPKRKRPETDQIPPREIKKPTLKKDENGDKKGNGQIAVKKEDQNVAKKDDHTGGKKDITQKNKQKTDDKKKTEKGDKGGKGEDVTKEKGDEEIAEGESVECVLPDDKVCLWDKEEKEMEKEEEIEREIIVHEEEKELEDEPIIEEEIEELQEIEVVVTPEDAVKGDIIIEKTSEEIKITIDISEDKEVEYIEEEPQEVETPVEEVVVTLEEEQPPVEETKPPPVTKEKPEKPPVEEKQPEREVLPPPEQKKPPAKMEKPVVEKPIEVKEKPPPRIDEPVIEIKIEIEEKPPETENKPPEIEDKPPEIEEKPPEPEIEENPPEIEEKPPEIEEKPLEIEEIPAEIKEEPPVEQHQTPKESKLSIEKPENIPTEKRKTPEIIEIPLPQKETPPIVREPSIKQEEPPAEKPKPQVEEKPLEETVAEIEKISFGEDKPPTEAYILLEEKEARRSIKTIEEQYSTPRGSIKDKQRISLVVEEIEEITVHVEEEPHKMPSLSEERRRSSKYETPRQSIKDEPQFYPAEEEPSKKSSIKIEAEPEETIYSLVEELSCHSAQDIPPPVEQPPTLERKSCLPCKHKCKKCSRIPVSTKTCKTTVVKKVCHCCSIATNTEATKLQEKSAQWESKVKGKICSCKTCVGQLHKITQASQKKESNQVAKCGIKSNAKRSSTFILMDKIRCETGRISKCCGNKDYLRPSTANNIYDQKTVEDISSYKSAVRRAYSSGKPFTVNDSSDIGASSAQLSIRLDDVIPKKCIPCNELNKEFTPSLKRNIPTVLPMIIAKEAKAKKLMCKCHKEVSTDRPNYLSKGEQCSKPSIVSKTIKCKQCHQVQTGGTFEQDMIASYVASCTTNPETPPPQTFITQTLLYQFAGYDIYRELIPHRRRRSFDSARSRSIADSSYSLNRFLSMRSVETQVGTPIPPKCEAAQTLTTFVLNDQNSSFCAGVIPTEGQINYICGPDVPGIRTKIAMNLNELSPNEDEISCVCPDHTEEEEPSKSLEGCASSICSYFKNKNSDDTEDDESSDNSRKKPLCKVFKNDKYVFITVTPVQTEPYEPNYYIILTTPKEKSKSDGQTRSTRTERNAARRDPKKRKPTEPQSVPNVPPKVKEPQERSKKQIFSVETLKSREFMELVNKQQELLKNATLLEPPTAFPSSDEARKQIEALKKFEIECTQVEEPVRDYEDKNCGPDDCTNVQKTCKLLSKDESVECTLAKEKVPKTTVGCGSFTCLHQKALPEEEFEDASSIGLSSPSPCKKRNEKSKKTKNTRSGPDAYCSNLNSGEEQRKEKKCKLLQTPDTDCIESASVPPSPKVGLVTVGCDAPCALVEKQSEETQCCDADICCNKEDSQVQASFDEEGCESDTCESKVTEICQKCIHNKKKGDSCDQACEFSVFCKDEEVMTPEVEDIEWNVTTCDTGVTSYNGGNTKQDCVFKMMTPCEDRRRQEPQKVEKNPCVKQRAERSRECKEILCPMKNTRLDFNDKFALEIAMNRFIKTNHKSGSDDDETD